MLVAELLSMARRLLWLVAAALCCACGHPVIERAGEPDCSGEPLLEPLVINEVMSDNEGAHLDEQLETEDYVEIVNVSEEPVQLSDYEIGHVDRKRRALPDLILEPKERVVFYADDSPGQGPLHLPLKLSSSGERLVLWKKGDCRRIDALKFPALGENEVFARYPDATGPFEVCRYASPGRENGETCEAPRLTLELNDVSFEEFAWPEPAFQSGYPLDINEVTLPSNLSGFVELRNTSDKALELEKYLVTVSPQALGEPWPSATDGIALPWGDQGRLEPDELVTVELGIDQLTGLGATIADDWVVSVYERDSGDVVSRLDFVAFPEHASLARPAPALPHVFCEEGSPAQENECDMLRARELGSRARGLRTESDFERLAAGGASLDSEGVKFVVDLDSGGVVHFMSTEAWDLHYTFVRELIFSEPHLDRCDPVERALYDAGWWEYSVENYYQVERSYYGGTLVKHAANGMQTVEFAVGDVISGEQMRDAFFLVAQRTPDSEAWVVRPQSADQVERARSVEGTLPLVGPNAPFSGVEFQPLTVAVGYGVLEFVPATELGSARLGPDVIVVTDDVPNDLPLVGGLITEAFQTPLSHVNVLSQNRRTPNMALSEARSDPRVAELLGELVRLEVAPTGFEIAPAAPEEAKEYWDSRRPSGDRFQPRLDLDVVDLVELSEADLDWLPVVGGKAAQFAELYRALESAPSCGFLVPPDAFAVPFAHFWRHAEESGARALYLEALDDADFAADHRERSKRLAEIRELVLEHPVDAEFLQQLEQTIATRFQGRRTRLRSSSNAEDLPGFNGAGLYTSEGVTPDEDSLEDALRTVWASLYSQRAHDEREFANMDHRNVAMGVLVHEAYTSERARGVAVSRNIFEPIRSDIHYINAQAGEATVTNPAPGITTEQIIYERLRNPPVVSYRSRSNLFAGDILNPTEINQLSCALNVLNSHFSTLLDPEATDPYFAIEVEFKFVGAFRELLIKQARQHPIVSHDIAPACRMF